MAEIPVVTEDDVALGDGESEAEGITVGGRRKPSGTPVPALAVQLNKEGKGSMSPDKALDSSIEGKLPRRLERKSGAGAKNSELSKAAGAEVTAIIKGCPGGVGLKLVGTKAFAVARISPGEPAFVVELTTPPPL